MTNVIQEDVNMVEAWRNRDSPIKPIRIFVVMVRIINSNGQRLRDGQFYTLSLHDALPI